MKTAVVIGNGKTRAAFDLKAIPSSWLTFGCNLVYRDFMPDFIIAIDPEVVSKISFDSAVPPHKAIFPPMLERLEMNGSGRSSNAGMNAMYEAIKRGCTRIYCLGFDSFLQDADEAVLTGNVFAGDPLYQGQRQATVLDGQFRAEYMIWFARHFPEVTFLFVYPFDETQKIAVAAENIVTINREAFEHQQEHDA